MADKPLQIPVQQYKSKTPGNRPASLLDGQLGVQQADGILFWPDANSNVQGFSLRGATGTAVVDFGTAGSMATSATITGQANILATSAVAARIVATATADHSVDEHVIEGIDITAGNIVPGTGLTIYATSQSTPLYGKWSVSWNWS